MSTNALFGLWLEAAMSRCTVYPPVGTPPPASVLPTRRLFGATHSTGLGVSRPELPRLSFASHLRCERRPVPWPTKGSVQRAAEWWAARSGPAPTWLQYAPAVAYCSGGPETSSEAGRTACLRPDSPPGPPGLPGPMSPFLRSPECHPRRLPPFGQCFLRPGPGLAWASVAAM